MSGCGRDGVEPCLPHDIADSSCCIPSHVTRGAKRWGRVGREEDNAYVPTLPIMAIRVVGEELGGLFVGSQISQKNLYFINYKEYIVYIGKLMINRKIYYISKI